jgi:cytoskeletal protein CcmA (bactofilin family)
MHGTCRTPHNAEVSSIPQKAVVTGDVINDGDLAVHGSVTGTVVVRAGGLVVEPTGRVRGDLRAPTIVVQGQVRGGLSATERITIVPGARVEGSLTAPVIVIEEGARFDGDIDMGRRTIAARVAEYRDGHRRGPVSTTDDDVP